MILLDFFAQICYYKLYLNRPDEWLSNQATNGGCKVMEDPKIEDKLNELLKEFDVAASPEHQRLANLARQASANFQKLRKSVDSLQESLDYLRVCIKYQLFDLEATRRENKKLKEMLEKKTEND
jgi:hypothetical protein